MADSIRLKVTIETLEKGDEWGSFYENEDGTWSDNDGGQVANTLPEFCKFLSKEIPYIHDPNNW